MINQGNVLMGSSLALITTVTCKDGEKEDKDDIKGVILNVVKKHIEMRFNKQRFATGGTDLLEITKERMGSANEVSQRVDAFVDHHVPIVSSIRSQWPEELRGIVDRQGGSSEDRLGRIYVFLRFQCHADRTDYSCADIREETETDNAEIIADLQSIVPQMRVEFFEVTYTTDILVQPACLYHLASRVCGAMALYKTNLKSHGCEGSVVSDTEDEVIPIRALEVIPLFDKDGKISDPIRPASVVRKILDLRDAVDLVCEGLDGSMNFFPPVPRGMQGIFRGEDNKSKVVATRYKFPFGVWFRGQSRVCLDLTPSLYQEQQWTCMHDDCGKLNCERTMYDESTMVHNFMAHRATLRRDYNDAFEWLCLMQHYGAPSRVLDWSENILTALYFAVADTTADCDGVVWALNAGRLNEVTRVSDSKRYVCLANSADVVLRSAMALSRTGRELRRTLLKTGKLEEVEAAVNDETFWRWTLGDESVTPSRTLAKLACPVAVFPTRINERESMQLATFTIYGGKAYDREVEQIERWERFLPPRGLLWVDRHLQQSSDDDPLKDNNDDMWVPRGKPFLDMYVVPSCAKRKLREQLKRIGIHVGSLFPELEYQGKYIRHQWRFER